ncbi:hypothetical protein ABN16_02555 [Levilactobacillus koreensis]|uniref:Uncharacterized protein n=1 Tax=Levilactobacillus koreensis TaxID=637971 RepID=A0AAC8UUI2_9LACO|nr:hypothetical protein ABN16_02555 [Levilactobacillus koreensis]
MEPAVEVVLAGDLTSLQHGRLWRHGFSWLQIESEARSLAGAFPQQVESLATVVRSIYMSFIYSFRGLTP